MRILPPQKGLSLAAQSSTLGFDSGSDFQSRRWGLDPKVLAVNATFQASIL